MGSCASLLKQDESVASTSLATNPTEGAGASMSGTTHQYFIPTTPTTTVTHHHHSDRRKSNNSGNGLSLKTVPEGGGEVSEPTGHHHHQQHSINNNMTINIGSMMQLPVVSSATGSPLHIPSGGVDCDTAEGDDMINDVSSPTSSLEDTRVFHSARGKFDNSSNPLHHQHQQHPPLTSSTRLRNSNQLTNSSSLKYSKSGEDTEGGLEEGGSGQYQDDHSPPSLTGGGGGCGGGGCIVSTTALMSTSGGPSPHNNNNYSNNNPQYASTNSRSHNNNTITSPVPATPSPRMGDSGFSALTLPSDRNTSIISGSGAGGMWGSSYRGGDGGVLSGSTTPRAQVDLFSGGGGGGDRRGSLSSSHRNPQAHPPHLSLQAQLRIAEAEFESSSQHGYNSSHTNIGSAATPTSTVVDTIRKLSLTNRASYLTSSIGNVGGGGVSSSRPDMSHPTISPSPSSPAHHLPHSGSITTALRFANSGSIAHPPLGHLRRLSSSSTQHQQVPRLWHLNRRLHHQNRNMSTTSGSTVATAYNGCGGASQPPGVGGMMSSSSTMALSGGGYQSVPLFLSNTSPSTSPSNLHSGRNNQHNNYNICHHINNSSCAFTTPPMTTPTSAAAAGGGFRSILPDRTTTSPTHFGLPVDKNTPSPSSRQNHRHVTSRGGGGGGGSTGYFPPISVLNSSGTSTGFDIGGGGRSVHGGGSSVGGFGGATTPLSTSSNALCDVSVYSSTTTLQASSSSPQPGQRVMAALHRLTGGARFRREITCDPHGALKPAIVLESAWGGARRGSATSPFNNFNNNNNASNIHNSHSINNIHTAQRHRRSSLSHQHLVASVQSMHISPLISAADLVFGHQHDSQPSMLMLDPNTVYGSTSNNSSPIASYRRETPSNLEIANKVREFTLPPAVSAISAQDMDVDDAAAEEDEDQNVIRRANLFRRGQGSSSSSSSSSIKSSKHDADDDSPIRRPRNHAGRGGSVVEDRTDSNMTDPGVNSFHTLGPRHAPRRHPPTHYNGMMMDEDATSHSTTSASPSDTVHLLPIGSGSASYEEEFEKLKSSSSRKPTATITQFSEPCSTTHKGTSRTSCTMPNLPALGGRGSSVVGEQGSSSSLLIHSSTLKDLVNRTGGTTTPATRPLLPTQE